MPSYALALDFINQFGAKYSAELLDRSMDNDLSAECLLATAEEGDLSSFNEQNKTAAADALVLINQHLIDSENELNSYLNARYSLPIVDDISLTPLKRITCDVARYLIASTADIMSKIIHERYKEAVIWLKNISLGKVKLAISTVAVTEAEENNTATIGFATGKKAKIEGY